MASQDGTKHAVVLSGGGADGAFEVGVMKALFSGQSPATDRTPIEVDIFSGTSVGSYNAAFLAAHSQASGADAVNKLEAAWLNVIAENSERCGNGVFRIQGDPINILKPDCFLQHPLKPFAQLAQDSAFLADYALTRGSRFVQNALTSPDSLRTQIPELFDLSSFISRVPFQETLEQTIPIQQLIQSPKTLRLITTNWKTGEARVITNDEIRAKPELGHQAILASSSIPGFFQPVTLDGDPYVDGGVSMNTPLKPAIRAGAEVIHLIFLEPHISSIALPEESNTLATTSRLLDIFFFNSAVEDLKTVRRLNQALEKIEQARQSELEASGLSDLLFALSRSPTEETRYRKIEVHVYHPRKDLGGLLSLLDFRPTRLQDLIARGQSFAQTHDCQTSGCLLLS